MRKLFLFGLLCATIQTSPPLFVSVYHNPGDYFRSIAALSHLSAADYGSYGTLGRPHDISNQELRLWFADGSHMDVLLSIGGGISTRVTDGTRTIYYCEDDYRAKAVTADGLYRNAEDTWCMIQEHVERVNTVLCSMSDSQVDDIVRTFVPRMYQLQVNEHSVYNRYSISIPAAVFDYNELHRQQCKIHI